MHRLLAISCTAILLSLGTPALAEETSAAVKSCPLSEHEGNLCAQLLILDEKALGGKISLNDAMKLPQKTQAHRGEKIAVNILAGGMEGDINGMVNLSTRLTINAPGKDPQELGTAPPGGIHEKPPADVAFIEAGYNDIVFDPGDAPGVYTVTAEVKDKVSQNHIRISRKITLLP